MSPPRNWSRALSTTEPMPGARVTRTNPLIPAGWLSFTPPLGTIALWLVVTVFASAMGALIATGALDDVPGQAAGKAVR